MGGEVGAPVGTQDGAGVETVVGTFVGVDVGDEVGAPVGTRDGTDEVRVGYAVSGPFVGRE